MGIPLGRLPTIFRRHRMIGLLPNQGVASFVDACVGSFSALELERDLLKVPNSSLIDAVNFHAASVSSYVFICICFAVYFLPCGSFMCRLRLSQAMLLAWGLQHRGKAFR